MSLGDDGVQEPQAEAAVGKDFSSVRCSADHRTDPELQSAREPLLMDMLQRLIDVLLALLGCQERQSSRSRCPSAWCQHSGGEETTSRPWSAPQKLDGK